VTVPILKKTILVSFELEYDPDALDPNAVDMGGPKATLCDVATYLDGLVRKHHQACNHHRFLYNLNDPEVFRVDNCTDAVISQLRRPTDGEAQGEAEEDEGADDGEAADDRGVREGDRNTFF
jgi:hypothetical protein